MKKLSLSSKIYKKFFELADIVCLKGKRIEMLFK